MRKQKPTIIYTKNDVLSKDMPDIFSKESLEMNDEAIKNKLQYPSALLEDIYYFDVYYRYSDSLNTLNHGDEEYGRLINAINKSKYGKEKKALLRSYLDKDGGEEMRDHFPVLRNNKKINTYLSMQKIKDMGIDVHFFEVMDIIIEKMGLVRDYIDQFDETGFGVYFAWTPRLKDFPHIHMDSSFPFIKEPYPFLKFLMLPEHLQVLINECTSLLDRHNLRGRIKTAKDFSIKDKYHFLMEEVYSRSFPVITDKFNFIEIYGIII